jgi:hypothetical protein
VSSGLSVADTSAVLRVEFKRWTAIAQDIGVLPE